MKKSLPVIFLVVLAVIALAIKRCNSSNNHSNSTIGINRNAPAQKNTNDRALSLDRNSTNLFFTKHARCRMECRQITQKEVKDILLKGKINYSKSDLNDTRGPTYAVEGSTNDRQHVRIIFAPKQSHLTVVTVIDIGVEHACNCN